MEDDPGWPWGRKSIHTMFVPQLAMRHAARSDSRDALLELHSLCLTLCAAIVAIGVVVDIALGPWWVYFIGAFFAVVGIARLAPTSRHIQQEDDELARAGCMRSLISALPAAPYGAQ
ncbi:MAG: hypothetical protein ABI894_04055 [Ilumatobacteraceae bacterium]